MGAWDLLDTSPFPPRWQCGTWSDALGWLHIVSDLATFAAYMAIPLIIAIFVRRRRGDLPFPPVAWCFVAFISSCGVVHLVEAIIFWEPVYRLSGLVKGVTALASVATAIVLLRIAPRALELPARAAMASELERSNRDLDLFASAASHDLARPLAAMKGFLELAREGSVDRLDPEDREYVERAHAAALRMQGMLDSMLDYARVDQRNQAPPTEVDPAAVFERIVESRRARGETIDVRIDPLPRIVTRAPLFERVVDNLLDNAIKYADGRPRIEIGAEVEGRDITFSVRDHGVGLPEDQHARAFKMFQRLHADPKIEGTGLGLAMCRRIVESLGGEISLRSPEDGGLEVRFRLPGAVAS